VRQGLEQRLGKEELKQGRVGMQPSVVGTKHLLVEVRGDASGIAAAVIGAFAFRGVAGGLRVIGAAGGGDVAFHTDQSVVVMMVGHHRYAQHEDAEAQEKVYRRMSLFHFN
jgi:hypothetical protein